MVCHFRKTLGMHENYCNFLCPGIKKMMATLDVNQFCLNNFMRLIRCSSMSKENVILYLLILKLVTMFSFNARIEQGMNGWYVGQIEEMPEVISQGKTIEELEENLKDALNLIVESRRETIANSSIGKTTIRWKLNFV